MQTCTTTYVCKTTAGWCISEKKTPLYIISAVTLRLFNAPLALPGTVNKLLRGKAPTSVSSECTSGLEWMVPKLYLMTYNHNILDSRSSSPLYNNFGIFSLCFFSYILIEYKILWKGGSSILLSFISLTSVNVQLKQVNMCLWKGKSPCTNYFII